MKIEPNVIIFDPNSLTLCHLTPLILSARYIYLLPPSQRCVVLNDLMPTIQCQALAYRHYKYKTTFSTNLHKIIFRFKGSL